MDVHVLSVGQCGYDDSQLSRVLQVEADAHLSRAGTAAEAKRLVQEKPFDLVLINRIIDGDGSQGVDLVAELAKIPGAPCTMLVSDYAEAQAAAVANGAKPGFGKSALGSAEVGQLLRQALQSCARAGMRREASGVVGK
jgi:hypothetical protein